MFVVKYNFKVYCSSFTLYTGLIITVLSYATVYFPGWEFLLN
jgi:hypothetical protein